MDLDDTLIDAKVEIYRVLCERLDVDIPHWTLWDTFGIERKFGVTTEQLIEMCNDDKTFRKATPHLFSKSFLEDLRDRGYHVVILTSRVGFVDNAQHETETYLEKHGLYHDELIVSEIGVNKMDYLDHHEKIHFMVDDQEKNCIHFEQSGKVEHVFMHAVPHNANCSRFTRLHNLYQAYPHLGLE